MYSSVMLDSPLLELPYELQTYIFSYLDPTYAHKVASVCKLWSTLIKKNTAIRKNWGFVTLLLDKEGGKPYQCLMQDFTSSAKIKRVHGRKGSFYELRIQNNYLTAGAITLIKKSENSCQTNIIFTRTKHITIKPVDKMSVEITDVSWEGLISKNYVDTSFKHVFKREGYLCVYPFQPKWVEPNEVRIRLANLLDEFPLNSYICFHNRFGVIVTGKDKGNFEEHLFYCKPNEEKFIKISSTSFNEINRFRHGGKEIKNLVADKFNIMKKVSQKIHSIRNENKRVLPHSRSEEYRSPMENFIGYFGNWEHNVVITYFDRKDIHLSSGDTAGSTLVPIFNGEPAIVVENTLTKPKK